MSKLILLLILTSLLSCSTEDQPDACDGTYKVRFHNETGTDLHNLVLKAPVTIDIPVAPVLNDGDNADNVCFDESLILIGSQPHLYLTSENAAGDSLNTTSYFWNTAPITVPLEPGTYTFRLYKNDPAENMIFISVE